MECVDVMIIVCITLISYNSLIALLAAIGLDEDKVITVAIGIMYPILYSVTYPFRAWNSYSRSRGYYQKHGITRFQYIVLFRRVSNRVTNKKNGIKNDENCDD